MKTIKSILTISILFLSLGIYAQNVIDIAGYSESDEKEEKAVIYSPLQKGNFMIGSGIGFSTASSQVEITSDNANFDGEGGQSTQINLSPSIGYFFTNNFAFGLGMDYISNNTSTPENFNDPNINLIESDNEDVLFGPFARVYFPIQDDRAFFISATLGFGSSTDEFRSPDGIQIVDNDMLTTGIGPGFTVMAADGLALEAIVQYNFTRSESNVDIGEEVRKTVTHTNAIDFSVGVRYYFGGLRPIE